MGLRNTSKIQTFEDGSGRYQSGHRAAESLQGIEDLKP